MAQNLAAVIKDARQRRGLTVYALAKQSGVSCTHLYAIEAGKKSPSLDVLSKVFDALGLRLEVTADVR